MSERSVLTMLVGLFFSYSIFADYEMVNGAPQFSETEDQFSFYLSLWKNLSLKERSELGGSGHLISQRNIQWKISECETTKTYSDQENFWYRDAIHFDNNNEIIPIPEANRPGYLYLNLATLSSSRLWGLGRYVSPKKNNNESTEEFQIRKDAAKLEWEKHISPKGSYGELIVEAIHRVYPSTLNISSKEFYTLQEYLPMTSTHYKVMNKYNPYQWPIYFDERAHKPHTINEPSFWNSKLGSISEKTIKAKLVFNWCDKTQGVKVKLQVPKGQVFLPGPNRPGRTDSGDSTLQIDEVEFP